MEEIFDPLVDSFIERSRKTAKERTKGKEAERVEEESRFNKIAEL